MHEIQIYAKLRIENIVLDYSMRTVLVYFKATFFQKRRNLFAIPRWSELTFFVIIQMLKFFKRIAYFIPR